MMPSLDILRRDFLVFQEAAAPIVVLPAIDAPSRGATPRVTEPGVAGSHEAAPRGAMPGAAPCACDSLAELLSAEGIAPLATPAWLRKLGPVAIAIGAFDGFHIGHRQLIEKTVHDADAHGFAALAVTFYPDPDTVVARTPAKKLSCLEDRLSLLAHSGVDGVVVIPFSPALAALDHAAFFESVLCPACDVHSIHVGNDFRLGRGGASTVPVMADWCRERGISVYGHSLVRDEGTPISASRIRAFVAAGDLAHSERELGRRYLLRGKVQAGRGEGTGFGFPTANVGYDVELQAPGEGVYSGLALVDGTVWPAAINVGTPPTFKGCEDSASLEANLIGFSGDIYGADIALVFVERLRGLITFSSTDELISCVLGNIETVRDEFGEDGVVLA